MVLQQSPAKSCVNGILGPGGTSASISVTGVTESGEIIDKYSVKATVTQGDVATQWSACLQPHDVGGMVTITATCTGCTNSTPASITNVTFGDVWYCGGQSNMALPLQHTFSRNISRDNILAGQLSNIRIHGISGNMNPNLAWTTLKDAIMSKNDSDLSLFGSFSSTCYYFGESLTEAMINATGKAPPIGLIHTAFGGSTIEQWLDNKTIATCGNASIGPSNQEWHDTRVLPYIQTTVKGFLWYQGENDMHGYFGNELDKTGYACLMENLVNQWRQLWSQNAGTTDPNAPFGLVTLPGSGGEGGASIGTMRWAQTANFGTTPNPVLTNVFSAQGYDLDDPYSNISCYHIVHCHGNSPIPPGGWGSCTGYCKSVFGTDFYMGPIHPRAKKPVGMRLAKAAMVVAYGSKGFTSGPQISGCSANENQIKIQFSSEPSALTDSVTVRPYYPGNATGKYMSPGSKMQVLLNASNFCMQLGGPSPYFCRDDGTGHIAMTNDNDWVFVNVTAGSSPNEVVIDMSTINGTAYAVRYGHDGNCCSERPPTSDPCPVASCPLWGTGSNLPVNPFVAHINNGQCKCLAPQQC